MNTPQKPALRPNNPRFSSGPCTKRPGWTPDALNGALLGRNHRQPETKARLALALARTRALLELPDDYRVAIVPASDTGAVEMALWSLLGPRGVDVLAWEAFSRDWVTDITEQLKLNDVRALLAAYGELPDLVASRFRPRRGVRLERHDLGRARAERRLHRRPTARASPSATRPRPCSRKRSTGRSSMPRPSPGRRCWAARRSTAC